MRSLIAVVLRFSIALLWLAQVGCAAQSQLAPHERVAIRSAYEGTTVALKHSCHFGDLYDDNEKWLLSPYPFAQITHLSFPDGQPIRPRAQKGTIPAGTRFIVEKVEFPEMSILWKRMLTTPRSHPWVYLRPVDNIQGVVDDARPFVIVLPMQLPDQKALEHAMTRVLAPPEKVTKWLRRRKARVRTAIATKQPHLGMTVDELVAAAGEPWRWIKQKEQNNLVQVAWYPDKAFVIRDGQVARIDTPHNQDEATQSSR